MIINDVLWAGCRTRHALGCTVQEIAAKMKCGRHVVYCALSNDTPPSERRKNRGPPLPKSHRLEIAKRRRLVKILAKKTIQIVAKRKVFARGRPRHDGTARRTWYIERIVERRQFSSPAAIARELGRRGFAASLSTVRRDLLALGFKAYCRQRRCALNAESIAKRMDFAKRTLKLPAKSLESWIFTDEKWFDSDDHGDRVEWLDTTDPKAKRTYRESVQAPVKVMVWGAIGVGFKHLSIVRMTADEDGRPRRLNGERFRNQCLKALKKSKPILRGRFLMQDGARVHWTPPNRKYVENVLQMPPVCGWPASSPDLNPIEHLWSILSKAVGLRGPWGEEELIKYVQEEWEKLSQETVDNLVLTFRGRLVKCAAGKGAQLTK